MNIDRIKTQVANIKSELDQAEAGGASIQSLHDALFVGLAVLEDEVGEQLIDLDGPAAHGGMHTNSGGSGKTRPGVDGQ